MKKKCYYLFKKYIKCHMILPRSPHFGGQWETKVCSVKLHIKHVIGNTNLAFLELYIISTPIETILYSRTLVTIYSDIN